MRKIEGYLQAAGSSVIFGLIPLFTISIYAAGASTLSVVLLRNMVGLPVMLLLVLLSRQSLFVSRKQLLALFLAAFFGNGLTMLLLMSSYRFISSGTATSLHFLYPVCTVVISHFLFKTSFGRIEKVSTLLAALGIFFFIDFQDMTNVAGIVLAALSAATYSFYLLYVDRKQLSELPPFTYAFYIALFIAIEAFVVSCFTKDLQLSYPPKIYFVLAAFSILTCIVAVPLLQKGIAKIGAATASILSLFEPLTSVVIGAIFLNEAISLKMIAGCICILFSVFVYVFAEK